VPETQHILPTSVLDYDLPEQLIATRPAEPRDSARMLVVHRGSDSLEHRRVRDLPEYLRSDDLLVFNGTCVLSARMVGRRVDSGGRMEGLFLSAAGDGTWRMMLRSNGRLREGQRIELSDGNEHGSGHILELIAPEEGAGEWRVRPMGKGASDWLQEVGRTPLPPYILRARHGESIDDELDRAWYQTVYADEARRGSVAAPTAGLHFTPDLLVAIDEVGTERRSVTLHVGAGTFKPITAETLQQHHMHREWYEVPPDTQDALRSAIGRRLAVGTTTVRTLETLPDPLPAATAGPIVGETDLMIAPPYAFRHVDGMLTNFHLPRSTLLALVGAMVGLERLLSIYAEAMRREYRFYSYGDAMLILP